MSLCFTVFNIEYGWVAILASSKGLCKTTLPFPNQESATNDIFSDKVKDISYNGLIDCDGENIRNLLLSAQDAMTRYFDGKKVDFPFPLDFDGYTKFQIEVWNITKNIPYGQLRSYGWIANQIGKPHSARAVGQALGNNPLPIVIPCHRVISSNGRLCGFTGGIHWKEKLINLEKGIIRPAR